MSSFNKTVDGQDVPDFPTKSETPKDETETES